MSFRLYNLQYICRYLIPALNAWADRSYKTTALSVLGHGCIDNLATGRSFDSKATWVIGVFRLLF